MSIFIPSLNEERNIPYVFARRAPRAATACSRWATASPEPKVDPPRKGAVDEAQAVSFPAICPDTVRVSDVLGCR
jgi:hypothetical protein